MIDVENASDPTFEQLKARALQLLLTDLADKDRSDIRQFLLELERRSVSAAEAQKVPRAIISEGQAWGPQHHGPNW